MKTTKATALNTQQAAASEQELPSFHPVVRVAGALEASLVLTDHLSEREVFLHRGRRTGVMEVENRHGGVRLLDLLRPVGNVQRNQVLGRQQPI
jgi:hypothetical protein